MGSVYTDKGEFEKALAQFKYSLEVQGIKNKISRDPLLLADTYIYIAKCNQLNDNVEEALNHYTLALIIKLRNNKDSLVIAELHENIGRIYDSKKNNSTAMQCYENALRIKLLFEEKEAPLGSLSLGNLYIALGKTYQIAGEYDKALKHYKLALAIIQANGSEGGIMIDLYQDMGKAYRAQNGFKSALEHYELAIQIQIKTDPGNVSLANLHEKSGELCQFLKRNDRAIYHYEQAVSIFENVLKPSSVSEEQEDTASAVHSEAKYKLSLSNGQEVLGNLYYSKDEVNRALGYYKAALEIRIETNDNPVAVAKLYKKMGNIYKQKDDFSLEENCYNSALKILEKEPKDLHLANLYEDLGDYYLRIRNPVKEILYYKKALKIKEEKGDAPFIMAKLYEKIWCVYNKQSMSSEANKYRDKALKQYLLAVRALKENPIGMASLYKRIWEIYEDKEKGKDKTEDSKADAHRNRALEQYLLGLPILEKNQSSDLASVYETVGSIYKSKKDLNLAIQFYKKAVPIRQKESQDLTNIKDLGNLYLTISELYRGQDNTTLVNQYREWAHAEYTKAAEKTP